MKINSQTAKVARVNESSFRLLVESVKDYAIFMLDPNGIVLTWNLGAQRIKGYSADEIIGKHFSQFYGQEDIDRAHPQFELEKAKSTGRYEEEGWRFRKDGSRFWANVVITRLDDVNGEHIGFAKVTRDLTEKKQVEEALRQSEERSRLLYESVTDYAMFMLDLDGKIVSWNLGAERINGYVATEAIGRHFSIFYTPEDIANRHPEQELEEAKRNGKYSEENWRLRKNGSKFWASVVITALRDRSGTLKGYAKITRDMSEQKEARDKLRMAYETLERRVEERTRELTEAVKMRDEFLSIASHELKTPLTPLKLQLQGLIRIARTGQLATLSSERIQKMADVCDRALRRFSHLVDNLLDVSRIQSGKLTLERENLDVTEVVSEVVERFKTQVAKKDIQIECDALNPIDAQLDRLRIEQVISNLLVNAVKYGNDQPIRVSVSKIDSKIQIVVRDQGIGISEEDQKRIFDRFERVGSVHNIDGMGLGLYITRQIVEAHDGKISVESKKDQGARFIVELPLN